MLNQMLPDSQARSADSFIRAKPKPTYRTKRALILGKLICPGERIGRRPSCFRADCCAPQKDSPRSYSSTELCFPDEPEHLICPRHACVMCTHTTEQATPTSTGDPPYQAVPSKMKNLAVLSIRTTDSEITKQSSFGSKSARDSSLEVLRRDREKSGRKWASGWVPTHQEPGSRRDAPHNASSPESGKWRYFTKVLLPSQPATHLHIAKSVFACARPPAGGRGPAGEPGPTWPVCLTLDWLRQSEPGLAV